MKQKILQETELTIRFSAKLSRTFLVLPKRANAKLPSRGRVTVEGMISCIPFRATLQTNKKGGYCLRITKAMCDAIGAEDGKVMAVEITRIEKEPETRMPADLRKALATSPCAEKSWTDITALARRDWIFSITSAKQMETRKRRIEKARDMLAKGKRRLCCFPGVEWMMKKDARIFGIWMPLPKSKPSC